MANLAVRAKFEPIRSVAFDAVSGNFLAVGSALTNPARIVILYNMIDVPMFFSIDGVDNHIVLDTNGSFVFDITSNKAVAGGLFLAEGTTIYTRQVDVLDTPTEGSVYVSVCYGDNGY